MRAGCGVKTQLGKVDVKIPRNLNREYRPKIIVTCDRNVVGTDEKILELYACDMSQRDVAEQIKSFFDVEVLPTLVSKIGEKILLEVMAWQNRALKSVHSFVLMDAMHLFFPCPTNRPCTLAVFYSICNKISFHKANAARQHVLAAFAVF